MSNYVKLTNNLELLKLEKMKENIKNRVQGNVNQKHGTCTLFQYTGIRRCEQNALQNGNVKKGGLRDET